MLLKVYSSRVGQWVMNKDAIIYINSFLLIDTYIYEKTKEYDINKETNFKGKII